MSEVFEDVVSDPEFSEEENGWSDEEIAQVLGLMSENGANAKSREASRGSAHTSDFDQFLDDFTRQQSTKHDDKRMGKEEHNFKDGLDGCRDTHTVTDVAKGKTLSTWGVFTPDKMPVRRELDTFAKRATSTGLAVTSPKKLKVVVPSVAYMRTKSSRSHRGRIEPVDKELTFRPSINKAYFRRRGIARLRTASTARFTTRMQQDIIEREERQRRRQADKRKQEEGDEQLMRQRRHSLVTKSSQAILERNGMWEESMEDRLERLLRRSNRHHKTSKNSTTANSRHLERLREKEAAKARACESLYRRGVDKLHRVRKESSMTPRKSYSPCSSVRSDSIVRERVEREVQMICAREVNPNVSQRTNPTPRESISFVEFSCVLLYFGFVPAAETPWEGDPDMTLLWHAWVTYAEGEGDTRSVPMAVVKHLVESVIMNHYSVGKMARHRSRDDPNVRLLEIFKLNYIARKRSQSSSVGEDSRKKDKTKSKSRRSGVSYSLHGKVVRSPDDAFDLLDMRHNLAQERVEIMRREKEQKGLEECTFKPRISSTGAAESVTRFKFCESDETSSLTENETFDRLYTDAFVRQNNNMTQFLRARRDEEERHKREMRVSPTYLNGLTIEERLDRLHASLSNNALPVHFYEKIAEMRHAYETKLEDAREKANRLEPAHVFPRTKDGHTVIVPFKFATQERVKDDRRKRTGTIGHQQRHSRLSTTSALEELRLQYEQCDESLKATCMDAPDSDAEDIDAADLCIDVHVSPFETYQLRLNRGEDVYKATKLFAETYNLDAAQQSQLLHHAKAKLEQLVDL